MNTGSGRNLNWFWQRWFYEDGFPDLAIANVTEVRGQYTIVVEAKGTKPVPVDLTITFADNSTQKVHRSIDVWEQGAKTVQIAVPTSGKAVKKILLGSTYVPDSNKQDNVYEVK